MKLIHLSDLHIGKMLHGYSLREDQVYILRQIVDIVCEQAPDAVLIAGDIYDRSIPAGDAVTLFDQFLEELNTRAPQTEIVIIAGNHDSPERLGYASGFLRRHRIHISSMIPQTNDGHLMQVELEDAWGKAVIWLLPFVKPGFFTEELGAAWRKEATEGLREQQKAGGQPETVLETAEPLPVRPQNTQEAVRFLLSRENIDTSVRNIIVTHQLYVSGGILPVPSDSEQLSLQIGGLDQVDTGLLSSFEYGALGHIHRPQQTLQPNYRYCGTPLQYSAGEADHEKSVTLVTLREKGMPAEIEAITLKPLHRVRRLEGTLADLIRQGREDADLAADYVSITLTDAGELFQAHEQLEEVYPRILEVRTQNGPAETEQHREGEQDGKEMTPSELFDTFYREIWGCEMREEEKRYLEEVMTDETASN